MEGWYYLELATMSDGAMHLSGDVFSVADLIYFKCSVYMIISKYQIHHLGLYCILFCIFLVSQINVALQLTRL